MAWQGNSPNRTRGRSWQRIRAMVLAEEPFCRWCAERCMVTLHSRSVICDHITPLAEGGTDDRANLAGMCTMHHDEKTAAEAARAQGRSAPTMRVRVTIGPDGWPIK
jgi:5-methylcytosine-specific restriction protein A